MDEDGAVRYGVIVNGNSNYSNFAFDVFSVQTVISIVPFVYIIPTCAVILRILDVYVRKGVKRKDEMVNRHVFLVIICSQLTSVFFFLSDVFTIRLPSTGFMTSWCYNHEPSRSLNLLFMTQMYFTYTDMMFPALLSIVRLVPIYYPNNHSEMNSKIVRISIPLIHVYPLLLTFFMLPALGVCRQYPDMFGFGAVYIHFIGSWRELKNAPFEFLSSVFWLSVFLSSNFALHRKLRQLRKFGINSLHTNRSSRYRKAEVSLTLTSISMILAYLTNIVFLITFAIDPHLGAYAVLFRPFGTELKTCMVTWVFYMTHPAFYDKKTILNSNSNLFRHKTLMTS